MLIVESFLQAARRCARASRQRRRLDAVDSLERSRGIVEERLSSAGFTGEF